MAGGKLEVQIGADKSDFDKKIKEVEFDIKELSKVKLEKLKLGLDTTEINSQIKDAKNNLNTLKSTVKDAGQSFSQMAPKVANGGNALMQFSRIAQDAPFGIMGIGNNITATVESFGYLKQATGSTGGALKALGQSILGSGGILLGVSLLTTGLTYLAQSGLSVGDVIDKITGKTDKYKEALKNVNEQAFNSKSVQEAVTTVNSLTNEIDLAKNGFLNKDKVVEHYNETIGKTTGLVKSIEEAEKSLQNNAEAYIKMTLYKAAANIALEEAAKKQLEAERVRIKKLEDFSNRFLEVNLTQIRSEEQYNAVQKNIQKQREKRKQEEIKINEDAAKINLDIAKKFQSDAAKLAKDFNFNFFGDNKEGKKTFNTPQVSALPQLIVPAPIFDITTVEQFTGQVDEFGNKIKELPGTIKTAFKGVPQVVNEETIKLGIILAQFSQSLNDLINNSLAPALSNLGASLGEALATGTDVVSALGQSLLQSLGSFISELGKMLIQYGLLLVGFGKAQLAFQAGDPITKIGAGIAMIALGVAASAAGAAIGSFASGNGRGGGGMTSNTGSGANNTSFSGSSFASRGNDGGTVVFEIAGQKLVGVLSNTLNANRRLGGSLGL